jgi:UDP-N-acetylglucosamine 2-epimerase (non-hydrolysing)
MSDDRIHVATVIGTRPEAIKLAPVIGAMAASPERFAQSVVATAQHRNLLDQMCANLELSLDHDLDLMREDQGIADYASRSLGSLASLFDRIRPDVVVVQGDTTTVMTAALAAKYTGAQVAHVEAGLRSFDLAQPFPEEINRRIASVLANVHFAPTETARANLAAEGIRPEAIYVTGNTIVDAVRAAATDTPFDDASLSAAASGSNRVILVTAHRRENHGAPLAEICGALLRLVGVYDDVEIVFPVHPNPHVREVVHSLLGATPRILLCEPLGYLDMLRMMRRSWIVLTDSGGLQEEAPTLGKPVLVLREVTERPEVIDAGAGVLVGTSADRIVDAVRELHDDPGRYVQMTSHGSLFGDGHASERIVDVLASLPRRVQPASDLPGDPTRSAARA